MYIAPLPIDTVSKRFTEPNTCPPFCLQLFVASHILNACLFEDNNILKGIILSKCSIRALTLQAKIKGIA